MIQVLLVGSGAMGGALKEGWKNRYNVTVVDPFAEGAYESLEKLPKDYQPNTIIFAVKPQILPAILSSYQQFAGKEILFITVAAGIDLNTYYQTLGKDESIVRTMPNLPVTVGQGMTALVTRSNLNEHQRQLAEDLFSAVGKTLWLEDEALIDSVTAISGSGPAYFFRFVECLAKAGETAGLPESAAAALARQTIIGAGAMLERLADSPSQLREKVTSPGGTTAAALDVFNTEDSLSALVMKATQAAIHRASELKERR